MRNKQLSFLVIGTSALLAAGAAWADEKSYDFSDFTRVEAGAGLAVTIAEGGDFEVIAEGSKRGLRRLEIRQRGDTLVLTQQNRGLERFSPLLWMTRDATSVQIALPELAGVAAASGADVTVAGASAADVSLEASSGAVLDLTGMDAETVRLSAASGADLEVAGRCGDVKAEASSGAQVDAEEMICDSAAVEASSGGRIEISARDVRAEASSGALVEVHGAENVEADTSSGARVTRHD